MYTKSSNQASWVTETSFTKPTLTKPTVTKPFMLTDRENLVSRIPRILNIYDTRYSVAIEQSKLIEDTQSRFRDLLRLASAGRKQMLTGV